MPREESLFYFVSWENICRPKKSGGLGIVSVSVCNTASRLIYYAGKYCSVIACGANGWHGDIFGAKHFGSASLMLLNLQCLETYSDIKHY